MRLCLGLTERKVGIGKARREEDRKGRERRKDKRKHTNPRATDVLPCVTVLMHTCMCTHGHMLPSYS